MPRGDPAQARLRLGPLQPRQRPESQGKLDEAVAEYREAIRLKPDDAEAHCNLGSILQSQGDYAGSLAMIARGMSWAPNSPAGAIPRRSGLPRPNGWRRWPSGCRPCSRETTAPRTNAERPDSGPDVLRHETPRRRRPVLGRGPGGRPQARRRPPGPAPLQRRLRRGTGRRRAGKDDPSPDEAARAKLREQAIDWLKAELAAWTKLLESGPPQARPFIAQILYHWKADTDLAGIREADALAKLPEAERKEWQTLWADVDAMLAKSKP